MADYHFPKLLVDLRHDAKTAEEMHANLLSELRLGHVLFGRFLTVVAIGPVDELIVEVDQQTVALVHLVWGDHAAWPPYPKTQVLDSPERLDEHLETYVRSHRHC